MKIAVPHKRSALYPVIKRYVTSHYKYYLLLAVLLASFGIGLLSYKRVYVPLVEYIREVREGTRTPDALTMINEAKKSLETELRMYMENGLATLYIDLPFEGYQKIVNKREEALKIGILNTTDADFVNATVHISGGTELDAEMRLKGDWTDHLEGDKWSFRIHLKEDGEILHTRQFSIQSPETRKFLFEWAFHQNLVQEGILSPRYEFINVLLNGKLLGIYALEENFTAELIESQGRRQGVIVRFNENLMWEKRTTFWAVNAQNLGDFLVTSLWNSEITPFQETRITNDPALKAQAEAAIGLLRAYQTGQLKASEIFDVELVGRFYALSDLWAVAHGLAWHNLRFYYNPVTTRLEPVPYDNEPFAQGYERQSLVTMFASTGIFNDPDIRAAYARNLQRLCQDGYVENLRASLRNEQFRLKNALMVEFPTQELSPDWNEVKERSTILSLELQPIQPVRGNFQVHGLDTNSKGSASLEIEVGNMMVLPVEIIRVELDGTPLPGAHEPTILPAINPHNNQYEPVKMTFTLGDNRQLKPANHQVEVIVRLVGLTQEIRVTLVNGLPPHAALLNPTPEQPNMDEIVYLHTFLNRFDSRTLTVSPGAWDVTGDLILPPGVTLIIPAGTVLRFSPGAILYTTGPLIITGQANAPVLLTAQQDSWGGIVVISAPEGSTWSYAAVEKTGGINRAGWTLTGGITFFQSDITLDHVLIGNNQTEDAINVIHGKFIFKNSEFSTTFADAFDSDFSSGEITNCTFHDISGDAVDVSGTTAAVHNSRMERIGDKGISVGENSTITVTGVTMDTVGIGIASKDLSRATVTQTTIRKARFAALAAYIKKPVFGPATIEALDILIHDSEKEAVAQTGSTILLRGKPVPTVDLDVDLLYRQGILGN